MDGAKSINLTGEQKKVLFLPATNPIQIKGVDGSGKTTIAMYRAKHLLDIYSDLFREAEIMNFTYNNSLTQYIQSLLPYVIGGYQENTDTIERPNCKNHLYSDFRSHKPLDLTTLAVDDEIYLTSLGVSIVSSVSKQDTITAGKSVLIVESDVEIGQSCKLSKVIANKKE